MIVAEIEANNIKVKELAGEEGGKVAQNVVAGVAGVFIPVLWFGMDFKGAASKEVAALQARQQYLTTLATERCAKRDGDRSTKTHLVATMAKFKTWVASPFDADWPPQEPITIADLVTEARAVDWDFSTWCYASGYDANDPAARRMFECLLAYARSEGGARLN
jgi:hypothetical protein